MPETPENEPQNQNSGGGNDPEGAPEEGFWKKLGETLDSRIDAGVERALKKYRPTGTQRTEGRTTVPGIIADIMFGKQKQ